jgi:DNA-binding XRE family transcriptional regulator
VADVGFDGLYCTVRSLPNTKMGNQNRKASPEIRWRLSTNLRRLRKARGYTQRQLAKLCGFSTSYIGNVEQGSVNITLANLETLAKGLNCAAEDLLRRPPDRNPS